MHEKLYEDSELIIGLVCAAGTDLNSIIQTMKDRLGFFNYEAEVIDVAEDILKKFRTKLDDKGSHYIDINGQQYDKYTSLKYDDPSRPKGKYEEIHAMMDVGNALRKKEKAFVARAIADSIQSKRDIDDEENVRPIPKKAFIIKSLKNMTEVSMLRNIYQNGFYLFGVYSDKEARKDYLMSKNMDKASALDLIERDEKEKPGYGQQTRDIFQLSDFFINSDDVVGIEANIVRILNLIFADSFGSPTFGEYAMFLAYCTSLRSVDLSRQIGAVICRERDVLAMGANECPQYGGGQYWLEYDKETGKYWEEPGGRDHALGHDSNRVEFLKIADQIYDSLNDILGDAFQDVFGEDKDPKTVVQELLKNTGLGDIIEFGRVVHAEMEAISVCARNGISTQGTKLYCTTFPCHVCAKHLISAGITKVVYIEPYPKSKAFDLFKDSISGNEKDEESKLVFVPFFGVGPRKYIEMFGMDYGWLSEKVRKDKASGKKKEWKERNAVVRDQMAPNSYLERESIYVEKYKELEIYFYKGDAENADKS